MLMLAAEPYDLFRQFRVKIELNSYRQLAVVQGLVMERIQVISRGRNVYQDRRCRTSFGVVVNKPYDELQHRGEPVRIDPFDKMRWAEDQIDWLIRRVSNRVHVFEASLIFNRVEGFRMTASKRSTSKR